LPRLSNRRTKILNQSSIWFSQLVVRFVSLL
jgi:hypothetical protein